MLEVVIFPAKLTGRQPGESGNLVGWNRVELPPGMRVFRANRVNSNRKTARGTPEHLKGAWKAVGIKRAPLLFHLPHLSLY